ncbi:hypothetical protein BDD12DRAFT_549666 [Trichophaea hybrida]|nr:hypothetical protein BDD12DRAFT_549666 [Trichophaea hybrida]
MDRIFQLDLVYAAGVLSAHVLSGVSASYQANRRKIKNKNRQSTAFRDHDTASISRVGSDARDYIHTYIHTGYRSKGIWPWWFLGEGEEQGGGSFFLEAQPQNNCWRYFVFMWNRSRIRIVYPDLDSMRACNLVSQSVQNLRPLSTWAL